ncbi:MAG: TraR/DksA C4-type zinc finger protein [Pseudomonadales bacterium]|jgi:RNA polymerase-binding transcription factor DksA|nr:TraR/DksA C4-type zinc finger protein [Pseudomonadales bacterium]
MNKAAAKAVLEEMLASIHERRDKLARHVHHREEPLPQDFAEQAVELENSETMLALEHELTGKEKETMQALARLEEGTYGVCTGCGGDISAARLQALPAAGLCFDCADLKG